MKVPLAPTAICGELASGRLDDTTDAKAGVVQLQYNGREDLTQVTDPGNLATQYPRNGLGNATGLTSPDTGTATHTLDAAGQLATRAYTTAATSNRLTNLANPANAFTYDAAGNIATGTSAGNAYTASYSLDNRLATMKVGNVTTTYAYDAMGQRVRKFGKQASSTVLFVYDRSGHLLGEYDNTGAALSEYVWLGDEPIAVFRPNGTNPPAVFYIHNDHLGAARAIVNTSNQLRWRWMAEPFATTAPETNPAALGAFTFNLRLPGQFADAETGLNYNYFRDYDPALGRYVQSDPIGLEGGVNTYAYVGGNPISYVDPMGLFNPVKGAVSMFNSARGVYQVGTGMVGLASGTGVGAALGAWRLNSGISSLKRAKQQWGEALCEKASDASAKNLWGLAPFGQNIDDPGEPSAIDFYRNLPTQKLEHWWEILKEVGTVF